MIDKLNFQPLITETWKDFEELFGPRGACGGCWCMTWRQKSSEYEKNKGLKNKELMKDLVRKNQPVGIIAYANGKPVGWCSIAPKTNFIRLSNSRVLKPIDDKPVWSIVCFYVQKEYRRKGISRFLIKQAVHYAKKHNATIIEAYPLKPVKNNIPDLFAFTGLYAAFKKTGFKEVACHKPGRPIMRLEK